MLMTGESTGRSRILAWVAARSVRQLVLAAGAVVLLVSGAFGGLRQAEPDQRPRLVVDEPHVSAPFTITIKGVRWSEDLGEVIGPSEFGRYLLVFADISTDEDTSVDLYVVKEAVRLQGLKAFKRYSSGVEEVRSELPDPRVVVTEDQVDLSELGPGLTYEVAFVWEQRTSEPLPSTASVVTRSHQFRQSSLEEERNWFDATDDAVGRFPVTKLDVS